MLSNFYTQGEICTNATRVFVHSSILDAFLLDYRENRKLVVGNPMDPETHVGALIGPDHMRKVVSYVDAGKSEGAKLVYVGEAVEVDGCKGGLILRPTIFSNQRFDENCQRRDIWSGDECLQLR